MLTELLITTNYEPDNVQSLCCAPLDGANSDTINESDLATTLEASVEVEKTLS